MQGTSLGFWGSKHLQYAREGGLQRAGNVFQVQGVVGPTEGSGGHFLHLSEQDRVAVVP